MSCWLGTGKGSRVRCKQATLANDTVLPCSTLSTIVTSQNCLENSAKSQNGKLHPRKLCGNSETTPSVPFWPFWKFPECVVINYCILHTFVKKLSWLDLRLRRTLKTQLSSPSFPLEGSEAPVGPENDRFLKSEGSFPSTSPLRSQL